MPNRTRVEWSQIMDGEPTDNGRLVYGLGIVQMHDSHEEEAKNAGGNPLVEIVEASAMGDIVPVWIVGQMSPRDPALFDQWQREKLRLQILRWYFDKYNENHRMPRGFREFAEESGMSDSQVEAAWMYLIQRGLLTGYGAGGGAMLTHAGIREMEQRLKYPQSQSNNLGVHMNQNNHFHSGNFGSVQIGDSNAALINQNVWITGSELTNLVTALREEVASLPIEEQIESREVVDGIAEEASKDKPKISVVKALIKALPLVIRLAPTVAQALSGTGL